MVGFLLFFTGTQFLLIPVGFPLKEAPSKEAPSGASSFCLQQIPDLKESKNNVTDLP